MGARAQRWLLRSAVALAVSAALTGGAAWYLGRESTLQDLVQQLANASGGHVGAEGVSGSLFGSMHVDQLEFHDEHHRISASDVTVRWSLRQIFTRGLAINTLHAGSLRIETLRESEPPKMPASLAAPLALRLDDARIDILEVGGQRLNRVQLQLRGDGSGWDLQQARADSAYGQLALQAHIGAQAPFALQATGSLRQAAAKLDLHASGDLLQVAVDSKLQLATSALTAQAQVQPFNPTPLARLRAHSRGLDLTPFGLATRLDFDLDLARQGQDQLAGKLTATNADAARAIDQHGLPFKSLRADIGGSWQDLRIGDLAADLGPAGRVDGSGSVQALRTAHLDLQVNALNLNGVHTRLHPTRINGSLALQGSVGAQELQADLAQSGLRLRLRGHHSGSVLQLDQLQLQAGAGSIEAQATLPHNGAFTAKATVRHFDPAALGQYPAADLNGTLEAKGQLGATPTADANFALGASKLLGYPLTGTGRMRLRGGHLESTQAELALGPNQLQMSGALGQAGDNLNWKFDGSALHALHPALGGALRADGSISGAWNALRLHANAQATGLSWHGSGKNNNGTLQATADATRAGDGFAWTLNASGAHLNPAQFGPWPAGELNPSLEARGTSGKNWTAALGLKLANSTLLDAPLNGNAGLSLSPQHLDNADIDLRLGSASASLRGAFGRGEELQLKLDAPALGVFGPQLGGALRATASLGGTLALPSLNATLDGDRLRAGAHTIRMLKASTRLGTGRGADDPLSTDVELTDYIGPVATVNNARLSTRGTRAAHTARLSAKGEGIEASAELRGALGFNSWQGTLVALDSQGRLPLHLNAPAPLQLAWTPALQAERIHVENANFALAHGGLQVVLFDKANHRWRSSGSTTGLDLSSVSQFSPALADSVSGDLRLAANWQLDVQAEPGAAPAIDGRIQLARTSGDAAVGLDVPVPLGLRRFELGAEAHDGRLRVQSYIDSARGGQFQFEASAGLQQGRLTANSPLQLTANANMASIAWLAPLSGAPGLELDGALRFNLSGGGSAGTPALNGQLQGERLAVRWTDQGIKLNDGQLNAHIAGDVLTLDTLRFAGPSGSASFNGNARLLEGELQLQVHGTADQLELLSRPDRTLVVSGTANLVRDAKRYQLEGKLHADRALIELAPQDRPTLSDDVIVLGARAPAPRASGSGRPLTTDLDLALGDDVRLKGMGLDAFLTGSVHLHAAERQRPRINGSIHVSSGSYAAYGQKLQIERGVLNFSGAFDNPSLSILALRKRPDGETLSETNVEAGVEVRGTALAPTAKLVSTPNVSDSDKLSWLVLGHGIDSAAGQEVGALSAAASALLGGAGGTGVQGKLASTFGLDEVGLAQAHGVEATVVTVGKRLSQRAYLSFEQGTSAATSLVKLRYKLNPRVTVQLQTGANSALDLLYSWAFD